VTIKTKLIANVLVTAVIVAALSMASLFSMGFLREKLLYLTEKSTPFQIRTIELQRELQGAVLSLLAVTAARDMAEYTSTRRDAEKKLARVVVSQQLLESQHGAVPGLSVELGMLAQDLFTATAARINSSNAATADNVRVIERTQLSTSRLKELDSSLQKLQTARAAAFARALEHTEAISTRLRTVEKLRDHFKDLQHLAQNLQNFQKDTSLLLVKGKFNTLASQIQKNEHFKNNPVFNAPCKELIDKLSEQIKQLMLVSSRRDEEAKGRVIVALKELLPKFSVLFLVLDQETELARGQLETEAIQQREIFSQSNSANRILVENSELVAAGLQLSAEINRLFTLETAAEIDRLEHDIHTLFSQIKERTQRIETALVRLKAVDELKTLRAATEALAMTRSEVVGTSGILVALRMKLKGLQQADQIGSKLHAMVLRQAAKGNEIVLTARGEQEQAVGTVKNVMSRSLYQIVGIGVVAIVLGMAFGYWIYRSVLLPLRVVLGAVRAQQSQGQEKAQLAEAIASGDLDCQVTISDLLRLDTKQLQKDEMGLVLSAVVGMSEAQTTLDRALADMTASLRTGRDEEMRRDRLKSGLHELNRILREEHALDELLEYTLAFMAAFQDAGVGILYLYNEREELLEPASTYAISLADRPDGGRLKPGDGLVGQVAVGRKMIHLATVPRGYLPIASALGEADPLQVAILPIMHNATLAGVLELGSFRPFGNDDIDFLQQALEGIAIAVINNRSRLLVSDLLEQTQLQAEELRVQQEELQQTNEELEERARLFYERGQAT
jgi:methyl-accepting chemotaxis protein